MQKKKYFLAEVRPLTVRHAGKKGNTSLSGQVLPCIVRCRPFSCHDYGLEVDQTFIGLIIAITTNHHSISSCDKGFFFLDHHLFPSFLQTLLTFY